MHRPADRPRETASGAELERLMRDYGDGLLRLCTLYLRDRDLAQDAVQETMVRVWKNYGGFRGEAAEKTWLTSIALNVCSSILRAPWNGRRASAELLERLFAWDEPRVDDTLLRAVLSLPRKYREVILLYYYQELSTKEMAQALNIPQNTVLTRLKRAREKLRPMLKEWYYDEP